MKNIVVVWKRLYFSSPMIVGEFSSVQKAEEYIFFRQGDGVEYWVDVMSTH